MSKNSILVLGVGNDILTDDGIGPRLVRRLAQECPSDQFQYETASLGGLELVELLAGHRQAVLIDAIKTIGGTSGDVYFFTPRDFQATLHLSNIHDISFLNALELGRQLRFEIPEDIRIIAVEIMEDRMFGEAFTPPVQARYEEIFRAVRDCLLAMA